MKKEIMYAERKKGLGEMLVVRIYNRKELAETAKNIREYFKSMRKWKAFSFNGICDNCNSNGKVYYYIYKDEQGKRRPIFLCERCEKKLGGKL